MHVHNVYFWLANGGTDASFEGGLHDLSGDPNVRAAYFGRPAATSRDVVESSYTYGLVLVFDDLAGHEAYQAGRAHLGFLDVHMEKWSKVVVHDIET